MSELGVEELVKRSEEVKANVCQTLSSRYSTLNSVLRDTTSLHQRCTSTLDDLHFLQKQIQNEVSLYNLYLIQRLNLIKRK